MKKVLMITGIIIAVVFLRYLLTPVLEQLEMLSYDARAYISSDSGPFSGEFKHADKNIVIVTVDDYSMQEISKHPELNLGSWPWRRNVWGEMLDFVEEGKPKAVLFDLIFSNTNDNTPYDREFGLTLRKYNNVVLATTLNSRQSLVEYFSNKYQYDRMEDFKKAVEINNSDFLPTSKSLNVDIQDKELDKKITYYSHSPVADRFSEHNMMAVVNSVKEGDSVVRRSQPIFKLIKNDETYYMPSLAFAGFLKVVGDDEKIVVRNNKIMYKGRVIPIDDEGGTYINWHGQGGYDRNYDYIHISDILLSRIKAKNIIKPEFFKDKIIIVGRTSSGTDILASSVNPFMPGPEANATALDNFLNDTGANGSSRKMLTVMPDLAEYILIIILCAVIVYIGIISKSPFVGLINSSLLVMLYILMTIYVFANPGIRVWIPIAVPLYYILMSSVIVYSFRLHAEAAKKAEVMEMFGKFVSPGVLSQLVKSPEGLVLKSSRKPITIMFCDVKDFTSLSEKCNPEQLVHGLNGLFNEIVNIVFANKGTVDKFVGDCIMAYWGDPIASEDDAFMAVKTALDVKKRVNELKVANAKEGKIVFDVKIGVNTGEALLGLAGSDKIMSYTAMGDAVNVASRLETACSRLSKDILISKTTYEKVKEKIVAIEVGEIKVKGKDKHINVYEPIGFSQKLDIEENEPEEG